MSLSIKRGPRATTSFSNPLTVDARRPVTRLCAELTSSWLFTTFVLPCVLRNCASNGSKFFRCYREQSSIIDHAGDGIECSRITVRFCSHWGTPWLLIYNGSLVFVIFAHPHERLKLLIYIWILHVQPKLHNVKFIFIFIWNHPKTSF